jgi:hypothetical protein
MIVVFMIAFSKGLGIQDEVTEHSVRGGGRDLILCSSYYPPNDIALPSFNFPFV